MDMERAIDVMDEALCLAGTSWEHGLVIPAPRGALLVSMSLAADVCGPVQGAWVVGRKPSHDPNLTRFFYGTQQKGYHWALLMSGLSDGSPDVVLLRGEHAGVPHDAMAMALRFGGFVMANRYGAVTSCTHVEPMSMTDTCNPMPTVLWSRLAEGILAGCSPKRAAAGESDSLDRVVCRRTDGLCLPFSDPDRFGVPLDERFLDAGTIGNLDGARTLTRNLVTERLLHGIVTGMDDVTLVEACMREIRWDAGVEHPHVAENRTSLAEAVTELRRSMTGSDMSPSPAVSADTADGMTLFRP